ncbi:MAG: TrmH family RNA methyltransferase [Treponema sp.]|jgi:TrmH family RNA methyltransferase|nr:TrmH family RNA methyltransferase [Treponema sp.]
MLGEAETLFCNSGTWGRSLDGIASALKLLTLDCEFSPEIAPAVSSAIDAALQATLAVERNPAAQGDAQGDSTDTLRRGINAVRHALLAETGQSQADWDFLDAENKLDRAKRRIFPNRRVFLEDIRSPFNIGALFRSAESFGVEKILLSPLAADPCHPRARRTAMGCIDIVPWERVSLEALEALRRQTPVFALETGGVELQEFVFPASGVMIAGSEELGVSPGALAIADSSHGRVSIPIYGAKGSLNVSSAFAIAMYAWSVQTARQDACEMTAALNRVQGIRE